MPAPNAPEITNTSSSNTYPPAGLLRRLIAMVYDSLLLMAVSFVYGTLMVGLYQWLFRPTSDDITIGQQWWFQLGWVGLVSGFFTYFWRHGGQTLGMRAWRIQVVNRDGSILSISQCILRCLLAPLSMAAAGFGYLWCLWDSEGQTLHDKASRSLVIVLPKPEKK